VHRATKAGEASWLWAQQEKSGPPVVQDDKTLLAVFEKGLRDRNSPSCTLSQNGYGDRRVKARKCTCCVPLDKIPALHVHGASRRSGYEASRRSVVHQCFKMTNCRRPFAKQTCVTATAQCSP
jgi:hypothetical protein